jgi:Protein of unknown function (DUF1553)
VPESFKGYPPGTRAIELAEGGGDHPFLQAFAKPVRDSVCECGREEDPSLPEMLQLLNNANLLAKLKSPKNRIALWLGERDDGRSVIEKVYLSTLSRRPTPGEFKIGLRHVDALKGDLSQAMQDLQFGLMNTSEFLLRH